MDRAAAPASTSWPVKWLVRAGWVMAGAAAGAVAGFVWLAGIVGLLWLYGAGSDGRSSGTIPDGAWKIALAAAATLVSAGLLYYYLDWQIAVIVWSSVGGGGGAIAGLAMRLSRERKLRLDRP